MIKIIEIEFESIVGFVYIEGNVRRVDWSEEIIYIIVGDFMRSFNNLGW